MMQAHCFRFNFIFVTVIIFVKMVSDVQEKKLLWEKQKSDEAIQKMKNANFRCWIKTHKRMKWRLALRIAS